MSIYIAHRRKNNASNVLNVPSTVQKETFSKRNVFSVRRKQSICMSGSRKLFWNKFHVVGPATAKVRRPYVSSWNRGTTSIDGGWRNEGAVVQQLERPVYTAQTDNPVPGHASTCTPSPQACMWLDLPHRANVAQSEAEARCIKECSSGLRTAAVEHSLMQRLRQRERSKLSWSTKKRRTPRLSHVT